MGNFPRIQLVQRDYLNPTLGSPTGLFFGIQISWEMGLCYLSSPGYGINHKIKIYWKESCPGIGKSTYPVFLVKLLTEFSESAVHVQKDDLVSVQAKITAAICVRERRRDLRGLRRGGSRWYVQPEALKDKICNIQWHSILYQHFIIGKKYTLYFLFLTPSLLQALFVA